MKTWKLLQLFDYAKYKLSIEQYIREWNETENKFDECIFLCEVR